MPASGTGVSKHNIAVMHLPVQPMQHPISLACSPQNLRHILAIRLNCLVLLVAAGLEPADTPAQEEGEIVAEAGNDAVKQGDQSAKQTDAPQESDAAAKQDDQAVKQEEGDQPGTGQQQEGAATGPKASGSVEAAEAAEPEAGKSEEASAKQAEKQNGDAGSLPDNMIEEGKVTFYYK